MRIVYLSDYQALHQALCQEAERYANLEVRQIDPDTQLLALPDFDFLLLNPLGLSAEVAYPVPAQQLEYWIQQLPVLVELCQVRHSPLILLSSDWVFAEDQQNVTEQDAPERDDSTAHALLALEMEVAKLPQSLILRTAPLMSAQPGGGLDYLIDRCKAHKAPENRDYRGLTPVDDLARILLGICLQLDAGADRWGLFHYAGSEPVSQTELMHTLALQLSLPPYPADLSGTNRQTLNSQHLMETYGVHPRAWRARLPQLLESLCHECTTP